MSGTATTAGGGTTGIGIAGTITDTRGTGSVIAITTIITSRS